MEAWAIVPNAVFLEQQIQKGQNPEHTALEKNYKITF
jgi:hypothetical protein